MAREIFHHILAPVDGSGPAMEAGRVAIKLTTLYEAYITFVYIVDTALLMNWWRCRGSLPSWSGRTWKLLPTATWITWLVRLRRPIGGGSGHLSRHPLS
jgi:hypothetical protein